jgi:plastocyanin
MKCVLTGIIFVGLTTAALASSVTGKVVFDGQAPKFKEIKMDADPICMGLHKDPVFPETLVLGEGNTMANVIVRIKNAPKGDYPVPSEPVIIDQKGCNYTPRVATIRAGQVAKILNPDGTLHNVHAMPKVNAEFNVAMPKFRTEIEKTFDKVEVTPFAIKCDVHPWMSAWVSVVDHPYNVVTGKDGSFKFENLPAGTYEIEAWHEKLGTKTVSVTVADDAPATADFTFAAPSKG